MSEKKKILCVIGQLGNGGTERQLFLFLKYLDNSKYSASVVVAGAPGGIWEERIKELGVKVNCIGKINVVKKLIRFKKEVKKQNPDIIFAWSFFTNPFCLVSGKTPFVGSLRTQYTVEKRLLTGLHRRLSLRPDKIIVNSNWIADELISDGISRKKITVVFNIFESQNSEEKKSDCGQESTKSQFLKKYGISNDSVIIAGVGRDSPTKDFNFFVDVIEKVKKFKPNVHALLIGTGGIAMERKIKELGLEKSFTLTGEIPDARKLLPVADIFFLSSREEGMPNVLIEAIDAGCTPFSTLVGGVNDILSKVPEDLIDKILIKNRDVEKTADMLLELASNSALRKNISKHTTEFIHELHPEKIMSCYYNALFKDL